MIKLQSDYTKYKCWAFDCDGVLIDSNAIKIQAFRDVAEQYGPESTEALVDHHIKYGGISRFVKFEYLFSDILCRKPEAGELERVLEQFSKATMARLIECEVAPHLHDVLKAASQNAKLFVVSGGLQNEVREVLKQKGLADYFTDIFGSPDNKAQIFSRERENGQMAGPAVFVGDAQYDHEMAEKFGFDFIFAHDWTDFKGWSDYLKDKDVKIMASVADVLALDKPAKQR
ncbi:MAG: HAD family hydrolase [Rhodospirillaceae bacterium]|nr:MAG: HAD family hydrolase [Rhodospirillaceae bacterium]